MNGADKKKLRQFLIGLGIIGSAIGILSSSLAMYLAYQDSKD
jgi:hypothetical protein